MTDIISGLAQEKKSNNMKKVYKIIIGILILALAAVTVTFVVMKKINITSVDS